VIAGNAGGGEGGAVTSLSCVGGWSISRLWLTQMLHLLDDKVNSLFTVGVKNPEVAK